ncbi:MAG TPA: gamma-glutamylcyclotransferase family protein [Solirubrobacterales bacterium]|jgi:cation transport regulator ChaC
MTGLAVFGYASLVSPASAAQTLGRPVNGAIPARLEGWARGWTLGREQVKSEKTFARPDGSVPRFCLGLNLDPAADAPAPNGVLIELTEAELERLDLREIRYSRVEVTDAIVAPDAVGLDRVIAYVARPEHHHPTPPEDAIVVSTYPATVEAAFDRLGPGQLDLFRSTTAPIPVELTDATLVRDAIPEGNPRAW